ncbi:glycine--tRNA ligase [Candidatus Collierbacteria bacterium CG10_big_fil_rev_8_21_14_0_10_44_9]|uniref:Glycine--tRNA ligase n=1 Tax=Candidatus Collierbacteria bacterium CG10_big_fil_rev_8_21_14_0_10_44_9 TaxID=1974535 RepID=A0A2H0VLC6_9BACT|nr:MAG: glycine--tRNA ligase [Candidatus Collierbacteria bacterium CG10_big_fil_rev_8_21_14_0_10_44_9]
MTVTLADITSLAKRRGFLFPGSDIYGGLANTWDYGPLGAELKRKIKDLWWKFFITDREDMVGLDSSVILHSKVWEASGHVASFADAMVDCKTCHSRTRADHLIEDSLKIKVEGKSLTELTQIIKDNKIKCPTCGGKDLTDARSFNLLFPVHLGILAETADLAYLRGETAQGIFINFKNITDSTRLKLPFGVGQMGKSFRNEITKGQSIFRTVEFEQGEIEYFFNPETENWEKLFDQWLNAMKGFVTHALGIQEKNLRVREHDDQERSFYSKKTVDLEYNYPFGFKELWGLAYRTDYDLNQHIKHSSKDLSYTDPFTLKKFVPHVIEPAVGIDRLVLMILCDAYHFDDSNHRIVLKLAPSLAPYTLAVFPLLRNNEELVGKAKEIFDTLKKSYRTAWDDRGNIGKRYFYQDEMGTPFCVTVDHQTLEDSTVTVRDRDTTSQERVSIDKLASYIASHL